jgi:hypothetical protein
MCYFLTSKGIGAVHLCTALEYIISGPIISIMNIVYKLARSFINIELRFTKHTAKPYFEELTSLMQAAYRKETPY